MSAPSAQYTVRTGGTFFTICALTSAVLFVLKVAGIISVSFWLVFAPLLLWVGLGVLAFLIWLIVVVVALIAVALTEPKKPRIRR